MEIKMEKYKRIFKEDKSNRKIQKILDSLMKEFQLNEKYDPISVLATYLIVVKGVRLQDIINGIKDEYKSNSELYKED